jgi:hypothetical protein
MKLFLKTLVGNFEVAAEAADTAEAQAIVEWLYTLEAQEERQAIQLESVYATPPADAAPEPAQEAQEPDPFESAPATVEQAIDAVKGYAGRHGTVKAREMMAALGIKRTAEITDELVPAVMAACGGA